MASGILLLFFSSSRSPYLIKYLLSTTHSSSSISTAIFFSYQLVRFADQKLWARNGVISSYFAQSRRETTRVRRRRDGSITLAGVSTNHLLLFCLSLMLSILCLAAG